MCLPIRWLLTRWLFLAIRCWHCDFFTSVTVIFAISFLRISKGSNASWCWWRCCRGWFCLERMPESINSKNYIMSHYVEIPGDNRSFIRDLDNAFMNLSLGHWKSSWRKNNSLLEFHVLILRHTYIYISTNYFIF